MQLQKQEESSWMTATSSSALAIEMPTTAVSIESISAAATHGAFGALIPNGRAKQQGLEKCADWCMKKNAFVLIKNLFIVFEKAH